MPRGTARLMGLARGALSAGRGGLWRSTAYQGVPGRTWQLFRRGARHGILSLAWMVAGADAHTSEGVAR
jgi:hypothetical protein